MDFYYQVALDLAQRILVYFFNYQRVLIGYLIRIYNRKGFYY